MKYLKRLLVHPLLPVALLFVGIATQLPDQSYAKKIADYLQTYARSLGWVLTIEHAQLTFLPPTMAFQAINGFVPMRSFAIPFSFNQALLRPRFFPYVRLRAATAGVVKGYGGEVDFETSISIVNPVITFEMSARRLQLAQHPLFNTFGISGILNSEWKSSLKRNKDTNRYSMLTGSLEATVEEGSLQGEQAPFPLLLPKASHIKGQLFVEQKENRITIQKLDLISSLGVMNGSGLVELDQASFYVQPASGNLLDEIVREVRFTAEVQLSEEGSKVVGGYLALASGNMQNQAFRKWSLAVKKHSGGVLTTEVTPSA